MKTKDIHPAERYLRNRANPPSLYVRIAGRRRRLFINQDGTIGIIYPGKRTKGHAFWDWDSIERIYYPPQGQDRERDEKERGRKLTLKYQRLAQSATHTNGWLRLIAEADPDKSPFENGITMGTVIDGMCIRLSTIERHCGEEEMRLFREAMKNGKEFTEHFDFNGYEGVLWCERRGDGGDMAAGFEKRYQNSDGGYFYSLINDEYMIGFATKHITY